MTRLNIVLFLAALAAVAPAQAFAQDAPSAPSPVELTLIPAGATLFTTSDSGVKFGSYTAGGGLAFNVNPIIGFEVEVAGSLGIKQDLRFRGFTTTVLKSPNQMSYSGNLVLSAPTRSPLVPYIVGGVGGLTTFENVLLGIIGNETVLTANVGGGIKWYALRADYRYMMARYDEESPAFLGTDSRYGHRVYVGVVIR